MRLARQVLLFNAVLFIANAVFVAAAPDLFLLIATGGTLTTSSAFIEARAVLGGPRYLLFRCMPGLPCQRRSAAGGPWGGMPAKLPWAAAKNGAAILGQRATRGPANPPTTARPSLPKMNRRR